MRKEKILHRVGELNQVLNQTVRSKTGLGLGLSGVKRLMDEFEIESTIHIGTKVRAVKWFNEGKAKNIDSISSRK